MKKFHVTPNDLSRDERPIPDPDEVLYNNPDSEQTFTFPMKVKYFNKISKNQNDEK